MADFDISFKKTMNFEGGYVNDPDDRGGETKYGISKKSFPNLNIRELTLNEAKDLYRNNYWDKIEGNFIHNQELADLLFDTAVNIGLTGSVKMLQRILGINDDGIVGSITLKHINQYKESECLADRYRLARIKYYYDITNKKNKKFFYGWIRRTLTI